MKTRNINDEDLLDATLEAHRRPTISIRLTLGVAQRHIRNILTVWAGNAR